MNLDRLYHRICSTEGEDALVSLSLALTPASLAYAGAQRLRESFYRRGWLKVRHAARPVISVGNLTLGGSGKTPLVIWIADRLRARGRRPAVLSRGYRGLADDPVNIVCDGKNILMSAAEAGDEPLLIARRLAGSVPVLTGADRWMTADYAVEKLGADILVLDDGFQHLALHRDSDILLLDAESPFGNGRVFPAGPLREAPEAVARAGMLCLVQRKPGPVGAELLSWTEKRPVVRIAFRPQCLIRLDSGEAMPLDLLRGKNIAAFCAIAGPERFRAMLEEQGAQLAWFRDFQDHQRWTPRELEALDAAARATGAEMIVVTEKDAVKFSHSAFSLPVHALRIELHFIEGEDRFADFCFRSR